MDAQAFWDVIGNYNEQTKMLQIVLLIFTLTIILLSYIIKSGWMAKFALGIINLFIGVAFFAWHGTESVQKYFAFPLYLLCGVLFLYESWHTKGDTIRKPSPIQALLLLLYLLYPAISMLLGNTFPQMVTHIMPCPVTSLSIAVYASCGRKNKLLLALLTIWGLTGIKSLIFNAYEDMILLAHGIYGVILLINEIKHVDKNQPDFGL